MIRLIRTVYPAFLRTSLLDSVQYRASGMIWMIGSILEPTIYLVVWSIVAASQGGEVGGYSASQFAAYYIILMLVNHLTFSWIMQVFQYRVQFGSLSYELLRPLHPIHADIADNIAYKIFQLIIMLPALVVLTLLFKPEFDIEVIAVLIAVPVIALAFLVRFLLEWTLALAAFWTTRVTAVNNTYLSIMMFLSGRVAPVALLPLWLQDVSALLPFYYVVAFPVEIITGRLDSMAITQGIVMLATWLAIAIVLLTLLWRRAVRNFSAVGG